MVEESIKDVLLEIAQQIDGLVAISVTGLDGEPIASYTPPGSKFNIELASAQLAQVIKLANISADKLRAGELVDNLITTSQSYLLTRLLSDGAYLGIATSKDGTLGMMRLVAQSYAERLAATIPGNGRH